MVKFGEQEVIIQENYSCRGMRLKVDSNGQIVVAVKFRFLYEDEKIQRFVDENKRFIEKTLVRYAKTHTLLPDFSNGGKVSLLEKEYTVVRNDTIREFSIVGNKLNVPNNFGWWQTQRFFGNLLLPHIQAVTKHYADKYKLKYSNVELYTWRSAWGTHFHNDTIKYNTALVFVPLSCIEYVVAHELCHSLHPNHSQSFWAEVAKISPNYKEERARLHSYSIDWIYERSKLYRRDDLL